MDASDWQHYLEEWLLLEKQAAARVEQWQAIANDNQAEQRRILTEFSHDHPSFSAAIENPLHDGKGFSGSTQPDRADAS